MPRLKIDALTIDQSISPRFKIDERVVEEYSETPADEFPPVHAFRVPDGRLILADGFHRTAAARRRGEDEINAEVREGTHEGAAEYAFAANVKHGKQLTRDEKAAAVLRLREMHADWSHDRIAAVLDLRVDRVREIYQAQAVREETGVYTLSQRRARAVANLPPEVAGKADARKLFALTIERERWSKDESEAALRTLKDPSVDNKYKLALLRGERPPFAVDDSGNAILLPETLARQARTDEARDATGSLYEFLAASSALELRLREAEFEHMGPDDVRRSLDRLDGIKAIVERVREALADRLRVRSVS
jgi:ParB-like chromosome segregation protein Spo0J